MAQRACDVCGRGKRDANFIAYERNSDAREARVAVTSNKQLERTVIRRRVRAACASFHCAHAARWTRGRAAAELRRFIRQG